MGIEMPSPRQPWNLESAGNMENGFRESSVLVPMMLLLQLCLAVADLVVQMASWTNAVEDLIDRSVILVLLAKCQ